MPGLSQDYSLVNSSEDFSIFSVAEGQSTFCLPVTNAFRRQYVAAAIRKRYKREPEYTAQWQQSKTEVYEVGDLGQHRDIFWVILAMGSLWVEG